MDGIRGTQNFIPAKGKRNSEVVIRGTQNFIPAKGKPGGQPEPISGFHRWGQLEFPKPPPTAFIPHGGRPSLIIMSVESEV
jgi:hypothetical protein